MAELLLEKLLRRPGLFQFSQAIRLLLSVDGKLPEVKTRLYDCWSNSEVLAVERGEPEPRVTANLECLTGARGVMPHYFQDALRQASIERQDDGLFALVELFNQSLLLKRFLVERYSSLPVMVEALEQQEALSDSAFLDLNGLHGRSFRQSAVLFRFHSRLKVVSTHHGGIERILSDYFSMPVRIRRNHLLRQPLDESSVWRLGPAGMALGHGMVLGQAVMLQGAEVSVHIQVFTRTRWLEINNSRELINEFYTLARLLLRADPLRCRVDLAGHLLSAPSLGGEGFRLGQYQILRPEQCTGRTVSVLLNHISPRDVEYHGEVS
ncbi:MAG: type VI secretion system baseplate subunit TssG [Endozoicomonas sp.]